MPEEQAPLPTPSSRKRTRRASPPRDELQAEEDEEVQTELSTSRLFTPSDSLDELAAPPEPRAEASPNSTRIDFEREQISYSGYSRHIASVVRRKLCGRGHFAFLGCEDERHKVHSLLQQTVEAGEGNSLLVIGPRGSGKSRIVGDALNQLSKTTDQRFHVVRLNGLIHTDDKLALREIWRQLGKELDADEEEEQSKNYADTLTKLLAVLSHPAELSEGTSGSVADSVVFILDEFDLFATHARQTLLYNLFDIAQSRKAPIAVFGLTAKVNVVEMLEKRVKSRFSHRYVYLRPHDTLAAFKGSCLAALKCSEEDFSPSEIEQLMIELTKATDEPPALLQKVNTKSKRKSKTHAKQARSPETNADGSLREIICSWNTRMDQLMTQKDVVYTIAYIYHTSNSLPLALSSLQQHIPLAIDGEQSSPQNFNTTLLAPDSKLTLLPQLPSLALTLLICAARLDLILSAEVCNFSMAYEEYTSLIARAKITNSVSSHTTSRSGAGDGGLGGRVWSRAFAKEAWSLLVDLELLVPAIGGTGTRRMIGETEMVRCDVALEEIPDAVPELERGLVKWCKEI